MENMSDPISEIFNFFHDDGLDQVDQPVELTPAEALAIQTAPGRHLARIDHLEENLQRLALISQAMYELLGGRTGLDRKTLANKINEIDRRDGKADGRYTPEPKACPSCDSMICLKFNRCLFCGHEAHTPNPFDTLQ